MSYFRTSLGFSIELINWKLIDRGFYKGLPLYESVGGEITAIALVENPAIGHGVVANEKDRTIIGPVMIPNLKIFRKIGLNGHENCYWYFSEETIKKLNQSYKGKIKIGH